MKRILLVHLAANGDCLMATTIARQIKQDYPDSCLTWAISYKFKHIIDNNPDVDYVWEVKHDANVSPFSKIWYDVKSKAEERKAKGEFDLIFYSQVYPENAYYYDGTTRSSTFNGYPGRITVPVTPVVYLNNSETEHVKQFVSENNLNIYNKVILFECTSSSNQSFMNPDMAIELSEGLVKEFDDLLIIISSHLKMHFPHKRIIDASILTFRENAELSKYCTHLIGCSSGISWLLTSSWAKQLPMLQILRKNALGFGFASVKYDFKYWGLPADHIIETTDANKQNLLKILHDFISDFSLAKKLHDENLSPSILSFKYNITIKEVRGNMFKFYKIIKQYSKRNGLSFIDKIRILWWNVFRIFPCYYDVIFAFGKRMMRKRLANFKTPPNLN